jgi:hypothetical protein
MIKQLYLKNNTENNEHIENTENTENTENNTTINQNMSENGTINSGKTDILTSNINEILSTKITDIPNSN